jgi:hypothetical protein
MDTPDKLDQEGQFYPFISLALLGDENPYFIQCFQIITFHEYSSVPPPMSRVWDIQFNL